jgi:hypothetical protein
VIQSHEELEVYELAFKAAMRIFELSKPFLPEERYALTDQMRRSSHSVCSKIAEAEAAETQTWIRFAVQCGYLSKELGNELYSTYDLMIGKLVDIISNPQFRLRPGGINEFFPSPPRLPSAMAGRRGRSWL